MLPPFDLQGGIPLAAARAALVAASLSAFGTLTFAAVVAPRAYVRMASEAVAENRRRLRRLARASIVVGLFAAAAWLVLQAGSMADAGGVAGAFRAAPTVLARTAFGHVWSAQAVCLVLLLALLDTGDGVWRRRAALCVAALAVALEAGHSHAYSMYGGLSVLLACDVVHLVGAGAWLGGLVPLLLLVRAAPPGAGAMAARWFSPLGQLCIAALVVSSTAQGWILVASVPGLVGTAYGWMVLAKLALFATLLGFAAANRYRFAPALLQHTADGAGGSDGAKRVLVRSILLQTGFAVAVVAAAAVLSALPPAMHEQPAWPFAERFSLAAVGEDPDFRREVILAGSSLGVAVLLLAASLALRRFRVIAGAFAALTAWFAIPHLDLLLVPAYPTSFYRSPTGFSSASIVTGRTVYEMHCAACHGVDGRGDGPVAKTLPVPPADLTAAHLWMHSDGELFWWLTDGMRTPEGVQAMPGFAAALDDDQRWAAIDFIRAHNAGTTLRRTGDWSPPLRAPGFAVDCAASASGLADLRGSFVLLRFGGPAAASSGVVTVLAGAGPRTVDRRPAGRQRGSGEVCVSRDETVSMAYAVVSGIDASALPGTDFLIDDQGWLRAVQRPGASSAWSDRSSLEAELRLLRAHPVSEVVKPTMTMPMDMPM